MTDVQLYLLIAPIVLVAAAAAYVWFTRDRLRHGE